MPATVAVIRDQHGTPLFEVHSKDEGRFAPAPSSHQFKIEPLGGGRYRLTMSAATLTSAEPKADNRWQLTAVDAQGWQIKFELQPQQPLLAWACEPDAFEWQEEE